MQFPTDFGWWRHMQDTLNLCKSGYDPRKNSQVRFGLGHLQVSFYADNRSCAHHGQQQAQLSFPRADKVLHRWATHQESVRASPKLSHRLSDAADKPSSDGW